MKKSPLVSIVIPVYNRDKLIEETIDSAIGQSYSNIEVIIVDNNSTDNTWEVLKKKATVDSRIKIFQNKENIGPVRNWLKCLEYASGKYTKLLFSDDLIRPHFIERTLSVFDEDTAFVMSGIEFFGGECYKSKFQEKYPCIQPTSIYIEEVIDNYFSDFSYPVSPGCAIFRTEDLRSNLLIDIPNTDNLQFNTFGAGNDLLLFLLTAKKYKLIKTVKEFDSLFRHHESSFSVKNNLFLYYDWSRYYFVSTYQKDMMKQFSIIANFHKKRFYPESNMGLEKLTVSSLKFYFFFIVKKIRNRYYSFFN